MGDYGHDLEFGVFIEPAARSADQVVALSVLAEEVGYDMVSYNDHPYSPRSLDALALMSFVAARTGRVRLAAHVFSVPLRAPAVLAQAVASLDILSHGRAELGIGAGIAWDAIEAMGGRRLDPGGSVEALEEGIHVIRELWDAGVQGGATFEGKHYRLAGALPAGNAVIDAAAARAGREPPAIRRLLNLGIVDAPARETAAELARLALEDGIGTFIVTANDPGAIANFASRSAPRVREAVEEARLRGPAAAPAALEAAAVGSSAPTEAEEAAPGETEDEPLGVRPTPDEAIRLSDRAPWDDSTRPRRDRSGPEGIYTDRGRRVAKQLIAVHDLLRGELSDLRHILRQVRDEAIQAGEARAALHEMVLRQNDWTLGTVCARYCSVVAQHHRAEDAAVFPHLALREPQLTPVIDRLTEEHLVIHDAIQEVDRALVQHMTRPENHDAIQAAIDYLTDALLSHLAYEEQELVEPLARLGFYPDQVPVTS